ncbi:DUF2058 domain-containing protein [Pseudoxanthomonas dokdonensis]|uniref:Nucleoprotein/polynucleotide-associated enzyme n=1 Tax=Pseudoxanthomonas dokdonensis TaxID=344882 RepID=A0A0R0CXX2_9GAMM|nr:DUF2058 family protein [Pseudoxanthomonas dokdonensis]KRG70644.1 nucleoprotein/polynucleotide-associated enzyme [Pseudoxanthomonas dokdonensis]
MTDSLRDQLLGLGFKPAPRPERKPENKRAGNRPPHHGAGKPGAQAGKHGKADDARTRPGQSRPARDGRSGRPDQAAGQRRGGKSREDIDLAKAYAIRAQREKDERIEAERQKQEQARLRREAKARLELLLKDQALNDPAAEIARHFPYGGKIKRIYVTETQLKALNAGELGVVQQNGRYLLVSAAMLAQAEAIFEPSVALKIDPDAPVQDDPYADPQYQVPDDLIW